MSKKTLEENPEETHPLDQEQEMIPAPQEAPVIAAVDPEVSFIVGKPQADLILHDASARVRNVFKAVLVLDEALVGKQTGLILDVVAQMMKKNGMLYLPDAFVSKFDNSAFVKQGKFEGGPYTIFIRS